MKNSKPSIRELFAALLRLNDISQGKASDLSGLVRQNVSAWYTGRNNAISEQSRLKLLTTLGLNYGSLLSEKVHRWCVRDVEDAALVLGEVLNDEELGNCEIWHVHNSRYPGCIVLKIVKPTGRIWVLMYRPLMTELPQPINADTLRCGVDQRDFIIDNAVWESWLPPVELEPASFGAQITKLIEQFPFPIPPQEHYDETEVLDGQNFEEENQDQIMERLAPTPEELKKWNEVLYLAKLGGKNIDEIIKTAGDALGTKVSGSI